MKGLKKTLSIIALIVLIGTDFLNPISYAIEQEEIIFGVEENVELENENEKENIDEINGEDIKQEDEVEEIEEFKEIAEETVETIEDWLSGEEYVEEENKESEEIVREEELEGNTGLFISELNEHWDVEQNIVEKGNDKEVEEMDETVDNEDDFGGENSLIEKNKELDGENNIEKLNIESTLEIYGQEKEKLEINDMVVNNVKTVKGTLSKENGVTYVFADEVTFDGTNYINTDLKLFSSSFGKKDFDISFNVDSIAAFNPNQNSNRNNIMHIINEKGNPFQGFDLRLEGNKDSYKGQIRAVSEKDEFTLDNSTLTSSSFRFWTENNVLHYYDNGNDITSQDFSSTASFEWSLMFGAALDGTKKPFRYFKGILSDVTVYVAYDNGDKITLPSPTSPGRIFLGWYTDANFTHQVTLDANGKYTVGQNETLYARWVNYKVTIRSNESVFGDVDKKEVWVNQGAIVIDNQDNTLTIMDSIGQTTITAIDGLGVFEYRDISDCGASIMKDCTIIAVFHSDELVVTFNPNGGTFDMFGENDYELKNGGLYTQVIGYGDSVDEPANDPILPGYIFVGWYNGNNMWNFEEDRAEDNILLKAKWNYLFDYGDLDVYMVGSDGTTSHYALMDRNMGAEYVYDGDYEDPNFSSFGFVYQWGNNYGFSRIKGNGNTFSPEPSTSSAGVSSDIWKTHSPSNYASSTWITSNPWNADATLHNDDLWGYVSSTNDARQGPCPEGYHVPSRDEFGQGLIGKWLNVYGNGATFGTTEQKYFTRDVLMPLAGVHNNGEISESRQGICAEYWQSSSASNSNNERADNVWFCKDNPGGGITYNGNFVNTNASKRYNGLSVRCFKNSEGVTLNFERNGGIKAIVSVHTENGVSKINTIKEPVKSGREFGGWYSTNNFQPNSRKTEGSRVSDEDTLYAKWICPIGQVEVNDICVSGVTVSFYDEGADPQNDDPLEQVTVMSGEEAIYPNVDPTKDGGYVFAGWVDENGDSVDLINVTEDMDVFASFHSGCPEHYEWDGSECEVSTITVGCDSTDMPTEHATASNPTVTVEWDFDKGGWTDPVACIWSCNNGYDEVGGQCINEQLVPCTETGAPSENAHYNVQNVAITYDGTTWSTPVACTWDCNNGYHQEGNACVSDSSTTQCDDSGTPANGTAILVNVPISWDSSLNDGLGGWTAPVACLWNCDAHYHTGADNKSCDIDTFEIIWKDGDGKTIQTGMVAYGEMPSYTGETPTKSETDEFTYTFNGTWSPAIVAVIADATYTAQFDSTVNEYTITWKNEDGSTIDTTTVEYGVVPTHADAVQDPDDQYTYTFKGWEPTPVAVTGETIYRATYNYNIRSYEVTILTNETSYGMVYGGPIIANYGTLISINSDVLTVGEEALRAIPVESGAQYSYGFSGWILNNCETGGVYKVLPNCTITAEFMQTLRQYNVTFVDDNGTTLKEATVYDYGTLAENIVKPADPEKGSTDQYTYEFAGWSPVLADVTEDVTYTATYSGTLREYTITWLTEDGNQIDTTTVVYGTVPSHTDASQPADAQYTYEFAGWSPTPVAVTGEATYRATYNYIKNTYTITWLNDNGSLIGTTTLEYGEMPFYVAPLKPADDEYTYEFAGWSPALVAVTGEATYTATYTGEKKEEHSESGGMSGGGGRRGNIDSEDSQHGSAEENLNGNEYTGDEVDDFNKDVVPLYKWSYENKITTIDTLEEADPDGLVTRGHLAKMVVNYMVNVLGRKVQYDVTYNCLYRGDNESSWESDEIRDYATKACAFGVMGINMENNEFLPNNIVTRAEFGTVMSRVLWGDKYDIIDTDSRMYYEDHLQALKRDDILTQINDPEARWEIRKWVWLVFRRITEKKK